MFREMPIFSTIITLFILIALFFITDIVITTPQPFTGYVVDKQYKPERNNVGVGYGLTSSGKVGSVITSNHESEKYLIMVRLKTGEVITAESDAKLYYSKKVEDRAEGMTYIGVFTKQPKDYKVLK